MCHCGAKLMWGQTYMRNLCAFCCGPKIALKHKVYFLKKHGNIREWSKTLMGCYSERLIVKKN